MGTDSGIAYVDHTFNPWIGCDKVSPGCKNCYAEVETFPRISKKRGLPLWGPNAARHRTSASNWRLPYRWNREAADARALAAIEGNPYERPRVLCASLCDICEDRRDLDPWRTELWNLIEQCAELDWMLLTKRPECITRMVPDTWLRLPDDCKCDYADSKHVCQGPRAGWPSHAWFGTSIEDQRAADERIPHLLEVPARVRWLSAEPLIRPLDLSMHLQFFNVKTWKRAPSEIHLVVVGAEGHGKRPCDLSWIRSIRDQCNDAGVACFIKQLGSNPSQNAAASEMFGSIASLKHRKGADPAEWPTDLRVQQMPK